jgi:hypothetical protein
LQFEKRDNSNLPKAGTEMDKIFNQHLNISQCHICQKAKYSNLKTLKDNIKNVKKNLSWKFVEQFLLRKCRAFHTLSGLA